MKFKVGDQVRIKPDKVEIQREKNFVGIVRIVHENEPSGIRYSVKWSNLKSAFWYCYDEDRLFLDNKKFKVGDRVNLASGEQHLSGRVKEVDLSDPSIPEYIVEWEGSLNLTLFKYQDHELILDLS